MKPAIKLLVVIFAAGAFPVAAQAAVITSLKTSIEANLNIGSPNSSAWFMDKNYFTSLGRVTAESWNAKTSTAWRGGAVLQWNLTGLEDPGDTIDIVNSASFTLVSGSDAAGASYKIYRLTSAIDATTTWNTAPLLDTSTFVSVAFPAGNGGNKLYTVDVSTLLAKNEGLATFGIAILVDALGGSSGDRNFWSTAYGNAWPAENKQNRLSANYTVIPEPSTWTLLGFGLISALALRRRSLA